jgi:hypothetical protein
MTTRLKKLLSSENLKMQCVSIRKVLILDTLLSYRKSVEERFLYRLLRA